MINLSQTCMGFASVNRWEDYEMPYLFCLFCFMWNKAENYVDLLNIFLKKPLGITGKQTVSVMHN